MVRVRKTYMIEKVTVHTLKEILKNRGLLSSHGLYFKSQSDVINHSVMKFSELLNKS